MGCILLFSSTERLGTHAMEVNLFSRRARCAVTPTAPTIQPDTGITVFMLLNVDPGNSTWTLPADSHRGMLHTRKKERKRKRKWRWLPGQTHRTSTGGPTPVSGHEHSGPKKETYGGHEEERGYYRAHKKKTDSRREGLKTRNSVQWVHVDLGRCKATGNSRS